MKGGREFHSSSEGDRKSVEAVRKTVQSVHIILLIYPPLNGGV